MKLQNNLRCLFIGALWLLLNHTTYTVAQKGRAVTLQDLPLCAEQCADTAAAAVGCDTDDIPCLCSHQTFSTATLQCSRNQCRPDAQSVSREVLVEMCSSVSTTTSSTTTSSSSTSTDPKTTPTSSTTSTSTSSTPQSSSTSTTVVAPIILSTSSSPTITQSASSTVVIVQTVVVDQPSATISAAGRLDIGSISMVTRALAVLIFGLPLFILGVAAI